MGGQQRFNQFLKILCRANIFVYGSYCCHQSTRMKALKHEAVQKALAALTNRPWPFATDLYAAWGGAWLNFVTVASPHGLDNVKSIATRTFDTRNLLTSKHLVEAHCPFYFNFMGAFAIFSPHTLQIDLIFPTFCFVGMTAGLKHDWPPLLSNRLTNGL